MLYDVENYQPTSAIVKGAAQKKQKTNNFMTLTNYSIGKHNSIVNDTQH